MTEVAKFGKLAKAAEDAGNHEEAYGYYARILEIDPENADAWIGKAFAAGWMSKLGRDRFSEVVTGCDEAIRLSSPEVRAEISGRSKDGIKEIVLGYYKMAVEHYEEFSTVEGSRDEYVERCASLYGLLQTAERYAPDDPIVTRLMLSVVESGSTIVDDGGRRGFVTGPTSQTLWDARAGLIEKMKRLDPSFQPTQLATGGGGCATVVTLVLVVAVIVGIVYGALRLIGLLSGR